MHRPEVKPFFDEATNTFSYVVWDPETAHCAVIDSVLDFDPASGRTSKSSADQIIAFVTARELACRWVIETHVHADHLSAAPYVKERLGGRMAIGEHIRDVRETFGKIFNAGSELERDERDFDRLFKDGEAFELGAIPCRAIHTPGHTPACMTIVVGDVAFVGDTLFMPDFGTARCDFPGGDARQLYRSIQKIFALPDETRLFMCHDYKAPGREEFACETTVGEESRHNVHVGAGKSEEEFVHMRSERDKKLSMPRLIIPSVQVNMRAGELPQPEDNGTRYIKIPLDVL